MRAKNISALAMICLATIVTFFACKEKEFTGTYTATEMKAVETGNVALVSNAEAIPADKKVPAINKLARKYGVKTKVYTTEEVDRIPLFDATCLTKKNPNECSSDKLGDYLSDKIRYPQNDVAEGNEGYEIIHFVVDKNGRVANTKIVSTVNDDCEKCKQAALDIFNKMDKWVPARKNGENVAVEMSVPIRFEIRNS